MSKLEKLLARLTRCQVLDVVARFVVGSGLSLKLKGCKRPLDTTSCVHLLAFHSKRAQGVSQQPMHTNELFAKSSARTKTTFSPHLPINVAHGEPFPQEVSAISLSLHFFFIFVLWWNPFKTYTFYGHIFCTLRYVGSCSRKQFDQCGCMTWQIN